jgi:hypothetical protein
MPSPKAFLRDIADYNLDPKVAHTKASLDNGGRVKNNRGMVAPKVEAKAEPKVETEKAETADKLDTKKASTEKHKPSTPVNAGSKQKKAANANEGSGSVESNVSETEQKAVEASTPSNDEPASDVK